MTYTTGATKHLDSARQIRTAETRTGVFPREWAWLDLRPSRLLFPFLFSLYTALLVLLPSGNVFGVNIKVIAFLLLLPVALYKWFSSAPVSYVSTIRLLLPPLLLSVWLLLSIFNGGSILLAFLQFKDVIVTLIGCWFASLYVNDESNAIRYLRLVVYCVAITSLVKLVVLLYAIANGVPMSEIVGRISTLFGVHLMTIDFDVPGEVGGRFQFVSDILIPLSIFSLLCLRDRLRLSSIHTLVLNSLLLASAVFSFSRYLWMYCAVAACAGMLLAKKDKLLLLYVLIAVSVSILSFDYIQDLVILRFSDALAGVSDIERAVQTPALIKWFLDAPLMGHGMGSYTHEVIRSDELPYSYENQLLALCGQVGIVGLLAFTIMVLRYFRRLLTAHYKDRPYQLAVRVLVILFLAGGVFNPCLISSTASISFGALMALSNLGARRYRNGGTPKAYSTPSI